jgi:hypothetical protein
MMTTTATSPATKPTARVALIDIDDRSAGVLRECFKQFGVSTVSITRAETPEKMQREKYEACVMQLDDNAEELLIAARSSRSNQKIVIYGIAGTVTKALRYSKYCVNALLDDPVERQSALKVVRATYLLVVNEFRRYIRVPMVIDVNIDVEGRKLTATSQEFSGGGMSLKLTSSAAALSVNSQLAVSFSLPNSPQVKVHGVCCWRRDVDQAGVRFDMTDPSRVKVKQWIDEYLGIS